MNNALPEIRSLRYRPDIDGLRAVAVLAVLFGHLGVSHLAGGYVGVDVFFVISGYLISSIILGDLQDDKFSLVAFYERRIRRIFPALYFMLIIVSVLCAIYLLPNELMGYSSSLLATSGFASNFYFLRHSNYFDMPTTFPLLHTWSLAVEEQFYLLFPLALMLVKRFFRARFRQVIVAVAVLSFVASVFLVKYDQNQAFYMIYTRAWELLIGTMLSQKMFPRIASQSLRNALSLTGLAMILYPIFTYTLDTAFPGISALMPCIGSALAIGVGESGPSIGGRLLSLRPIVFIGLISYSLYLWHWPLIVFQDMGVVTPNVQNLPIVTAELLTRHRLSLIFPAAASLLMATLSWWLIELPFRSGRLRLRGGPVFVMAGTLICASILFSVTGLVSHGIPQRFSPASIRMADQADTTEFRQATREGQCFIGVGTHFDRFDAKKCLENVVGKRNYLLLGDSKAAMLYPGLSRTMDGSNIMQANVAHCGAFSQPSGNMDCKKLSRLIYGEYLPMHSVEAVILCKHWDFNDLKEIAVTVAWARSNHVRIVVIGPAPTYEIPLPRLEAYAIAWHKPELVSSHFDREVKALDAQMEELARNQWHVPYVSLYQMICPDGNCREFVDPGRKVPMLIDTGHLSPAASEFISQDLTIDIMKALS